MNEYNGSSTRWNSLQGGAKPWRRLVPNAKFSPTEILEVLNKCRVRYLVIGGLAATIHGSPHVTFDVDVTPERSADNLAQLSLALTELEARVRTEGEPEGLKFDHNADSLGRADIWNLATNAGDLDITFVPSGTGGYDDLKRDAAKIEVLGVQLKVSSLADVVRSKEAADRPKDRLTLPTLRRLLEQESSRDLARYEQRFNSLRYLDPDVASSQPAFSPGQVHGPNRLSTWIR